MTFGLTRPPLVARTAAGMITAIAGAQAATPSDIQVDAKVELPALPNPTEAEAHVPDPDIRARRLGVAVVGLGHLSLLQIRPGFGDAGHVRVTALVSGDAA